MVIRISLAGPEDLAALAEVNRSAYSMELPSRFAHQNWADPSYMFSFFMGRLEARLDDKGTQVFKACDATTGTIVGFACWTHEAATSQVNQTPTSTMLQKMPPTVNIEFLKTVGTEIEQLREYMKGEDHYYLSAFAVELSQQNQGIGSQLLKHCLKIADDAALPTWLISFPGSHGLYLRFGFQDVDHRDIDLNAWDNHKMRGFGVYRQYAMVRR
ncbi:acyl-CoA N-acyltransferase [Stachybotrys elegans]|uniref:Acyl-CoA N-acyltransferase n=1 Tax=Stachybotrys elegans TaxID=80388 RepID=A0A8K0WNU1_9HYPO|nr:acyl-CoA N-acyltransferase [Stachybotrys elegans]